MNKAKKVFMILAIVFSGVFLIFLLGMLAGNQEGGDATVNPVAQTVLYFILIGGPAIVFWILFATNGKKKEAGKTVAVPKRALPKAPKGIAFDIEKYDADKDYRDKVNAKIRDHSDQLLQVAIDQQKYNASALQSQKTAEINRILNARWKNEGKISVNEEEGLVSINRGIFRFSDILGAEINEVYSSLTVQKTTSKRGVSVGKAALGGMVAGRVGTIVGGSQGKTKGTTKTQDYEVCQHLGVIVNCAGSFQEIVLSAKERKVGDNSFNNLLLQARQLEFRLNQLAKTPMPNYVKPVEEYDSVKQLDEQIQEVQNDIETLEGQTPDYDQAIEQAVAEARSQARR